MNPELALKLSIKTCVDESIVYSVESGSSMRYCPDRLNWRKKEVTFFHDA